MTKWHRPEQVQALIESAVAPLRARIATLEAENAQLRARVDQLESENARLRKDSSTSSKPPSSDIVKPPPPPLPGGKRKKRRRGGQPHHPRHLRPPFLPEQVDRTEIHELPALGPDWEPLDEFRIVQQVELVEKLFEVTEHRARCYRHRRTGDVIAAPWPSEVAKGGLVGTRMSALIGYQKGACHMSYGGIERFFDDVLHLKLCRGYLVKVVQKMSASLAVAYEELRDALPCQPMLNVDGTGHPENRPSPAPTGPVTLKCFSTLCIVIVREHGEVPRRLAEPDPAQRGLLDLLGISPGGLRTFKWRSGT